MSNMINNKIVNVKTDDVLTIYSIFKIMSKLTNEVIIKFDENRMIILYYDSTEIYTYIVLLASKFNTYNVNVNKHFKIRIDHLIELLRRYLVEKKKFVQFISFIIRDNESQTFTIRLTFNDNNHNDNNNNNNNNNDNDNNNIFIEHDLTMCAIENEETMNLNLHDASVVIDIKCEVFHDACVDIAEITNSFLVNETSQQSSLFLQSIVNAQSPQLIKIKQEANNLVIGTINNNTRYFIELSDKKLVLKDTNLNMDMDIDMNTNSNISEYVKFDGIFNLKNVIFVNAARALCTMMNIFMFDNGSMALKYTVRELGDMVVLLHSNKEYEI